MTEKTFSIQDLSYGRETKKITFSEFPKLVVAFVSIDRRTCSAISVDVKTSLHVTENYEVSKQLQTYFFLGLKAGNP